ncbi:CAP domain-containing protein [Blastopirellula sp. JC732]|uniref:CAP domain-containing protein n=1 Tax=Blastopirellula sediminis TaxID=2894196 RepID=A0A9X1MI68_9BACT|nr:CAP domain-containing protein [Blastopirellula sediminis]MCC9607838.1 CAP domain-containing protein [Blastopirellula sediminis]MCC9627369.1 CAP domain-containing protein [Blastopirellula sediminis]
MTELKKALSLTLLLTLAATLVADDASVKPEAKEEKADAEVKDEFLHNHPTLVKMWNHSNVVRGQYGLASQKLNPELTKAAQDHAWYMAKTGQFSHSVNGGFVARARRHHYKGSPSGEIILWNAKSIDSCFQGWLNSPGHRAILLGGAREVGYGYAVARDGSTYWVGVYGN